VLLEWNCFSYTVDFVPKASHPQCLLLAVPMQEKGLVKLVMCNVVCLEE